MFPSSSITEDPQLSAGCHPPVLEEALNPRGHLHSLSHGLLQHGLLVHEAARGVSISSLLIWRNHESDILSPFPCSIVRSKSQAPPTLKAMVLHKDMNIRRQGIWEDHLGVHLPHGICEKL